MLPAIVLPVLLLAFLSALVAAQATREEEIAQQQARRAGSVQPYKRNVFEAGLLDFEQAGGFGVQRGFFVTFGDIKSGSGPAAGPIYGRTFGNGAIANVKGAWSVRNFKMAQAFVQSPPIAYGKVLFNGRVRWQDAPELAVYPLGPSSPLTRADYAETKSEVSAQALLRPVRLLRLSAGTGFERFETEGADTHRPSVDEVYTPETLPGLGADPDYLHTQASIALDSRRGLTFSRSGTVIGAAFHDYRQQNDGAFSFQRTDAIVRQMIPVLRGNWVIDLAARASTTTADSGETVPFFLLPRLGGSSDLRGFPSYRFRDRNLLLLTAEYRWYAQEFVEMALFYDAGTVAPRRQDLSLNQMESGYGIGIRFHGPQMTGLRLEVAHSNEGTRLIFAFSEPIRLPR